MLFKGFEKLKGKDLFSLPERGIVVDNDDPLMRGRIKCEIVGRWPIGEIEKLPWISPLYKPGLGGKVITSGFSVPEIESEVTIVFPNKTEYAPFYTGAWQSDTSHQSPLFDEDYPDSYGWCDSQMTWIRVNKFEEYLELFQYCGFTARMFDDGNVHINIPKNLTIHVGEDLLFKVDGKEVWEIGDTSSKIVESDTVLKVNGAYSRDVAFSTYTSTMLSRNDITYGTHSESVWGNHSQSIKGIASKVVYGKYSKDLKNGYVKNVIGKESNNVDGEYTQNVTETHSVSVDLDKWVTAYGSYLRFAGNVISDEAGGIHHNSGITPGDIPLDDPLDLGWAFGPDSPIGHGKLATCITKLIAKVEELKEIDVVMKDLEEVVKEVRLKYTSLGSGEFVMPEIDGKPDPSNVSPTLHLFKPTETVEEVTSKLSSSNIASLGSASANFSNSLKSDLDSIVDELSTDPIKALSDISNLDQSVQDKFVSELTSLIKVPTSLNVNKNLEAITPVVSILSNLSKLAIQEALNGLPDSVKTIIGSEIENVLTSDIETGMSYVNKLPQNIGNIILTEVYNNIPTQEFYDLQPDKLNSFVSKIDNTFLSGLKRDSKSDMLLAVSKNTLSDNLKTNVDSILSNREANLDSMSNMLQSLNSILKTP